MKDLRIRLMKTADLGDLAKVYTEVYDKFDVGENWTIKTSRDMLSYWLKSALLH